MDKKLIVSVALCVVFGILGLLYSMDTLSKKSYAKGTFSEGEKICRVNLTNYTLYLDLCPNQTLDVYSNLPNSSSFRSKYKHILILFDPNETGNYSVALLNLVMSFPKYFAIPVCKEYNPKCKLYLIKVNNTTAVFAPVNESDDYQILYEADLSKVLLVYLNVSNHTGLLLKNNHTILIQGDYTTIRKATDRFIYWWYGVVS